MSIGSGAQHVQHVVETSRALKQSGRNDAGLSLLGDIHNSNVEERFHTKMRRVLGNKLPEPYPLWLTVNDGHKGTCKKLFGALAPYEVLSMLYDHKEHFQLSFLGNYGPEVVGEYWETLRKSSWDTNPVFVDENLWSHRSKIFPMFWHSDGGEVFSTQSYAIYHWSTPFTHDIDPRECKFYMLMIAESEIVPDVTEREIANFVHSWGWPCAGY